MNITGPGKVISIYIGGRDQWHGQALYNAIILFARAEGMAGATATQGLEGYGASSRVHKLSLLDLSTDLPIKVEIVDTQERVEAFLPKLMPMVQGGMVTVRNCEIVHYLSHPQPGAG